MSYISGKNLAGCAKGPEEQQNSRSCYHISKEEIEDTLRKIKAGKAVGLNSSCGNLEVFGRSGS